MEYRKATKSDLEIIWNKNINSHPEDERWKRWKEEYIAYNEKGQAVTFVAVDDEPVGEITILLSQECKPVLKKAKLCDGKTIANMNAFRIEKKYEGQGHITKLVKMAEEFARSIGIKELSIGVEENEKRNRAIYEHFGFTEFMFSEVDHDEGDAIVLYYKKTI